MGRTGIIGLIAFVVAIGTFFYLRSPAAPLADIGVGEKRILETANKLSDEEQRVCSFVASLPVMPGQPFPSLLCWEPLRVIGQEKGPSLEELLRERPVDFLEVCLRRYEQEVQGYRLIFLKQERQNGKLHPAEKIRVHFREKPFSVHMQWLAGERLAWKSLYVEGENDGKLLAVPSLLKWIGTVVTRDVDGPDAKQSGMYTINQFGIYLAMQRTVTSMRTAQKAGTLHLHYEGLVQLEQVGNRPCYKLVRTPYEPPEENDVNELILYIDQETLLQVGSVLRDSKNQLIAEYFFRDIEINPTFDAKQFTRKGL
jgi:hypothetical protein